MNHLSTKARKKRGKELEEYRERRREEEQVPEAGGLEIEVCRWTWGSESSAPDWTS